MPKELQDLLKQLHQWLSEQSDCDPAFGQMVLAAIEQLTANAKTPAELDEALRDMQIMSIDADRNVTAFALSDKPPLQLSRDNVNAQQSQGYISHPTGEVKQLYVNIYSNQLSSTAPTPGTPVTAEQVLRSQWLGPLLALLSGVSWPTELLIRARTQAFQHYFEQAWDGPVGAALLPAMIEKLAQRTLSGDVPLLSFVAYLLQDPAGAAIRDAGKRWIHDTAAALGMPVPHETLAPRLAEPQRPYVLIVVREMQPQRYLMRGWVLLDDRHQDRDVSYKPLLAQGQVYLECKQETVHEAFHAFMAAMRAGYPQQYTSLAAIELFLPSALIGADVERWPIPAGKRTNPVGVHYPVMIRSIDRFDTDYRSARDLWLRRWQRLEGHGCGKDDLHWPEDRTCCAYEHLYLNLLEEHILGLGLPFPDIWTAELTEDILEAVLGYGIPIAIWQRANANEPLPALLTAAESLRDLPKLVWQRRLKAEKHKGDDDLGHHITLLWDDPHRWPPDIDTQLSLPSDS